MRGLPILIAWGKAGSQRGRSQFSTRTPGGLGEGRLFYGLLYPIGIVVVVAGALAGDSIGTLVILAAGFGVPVALCEWRARRMGFMVSEDGIELIRALNRSFVPWARVSQFVLRKPAGAVDYGQRVVWIERTKNGLVPAGLLPVPTLYVTPEASRVFRWMGSGGVKWDGGRATETAAFLDQLLAAQGHITPEREVT